MRIYSTPLIVFFLLAGQIILPAQLALPTQADVQRFLDLAKNADEPEVAFWNYDQALTVSREINYIPGLKIALHQLATIEKRKGNPTAALRNLLELLNILKKEDNPVALYETYLGIADIYHTEELYEKALEYYHFALQIPPNDTDLNDLHQLVGNANASLNQPDSALYFYQNVLDFYKAKNHKAGELEILQRIAKVHTTNRDHQAALKVNQNILGLIEPSGIPKHLAVIYNNIGYNHHFLKDYNNAIDYFRKTLNLCKQKKYVDMADLYTNLGIAYSNIGNVKKAIDYLQDAGKEIPENDKRKKIFLDHLRSTIYLNNGDVYNALRYNEHVLEQALQHKQYRLLGDGYEIAARIYQALHEYEKALDFTIQHLALRDSFILEDRLRQQELLQQQFLLERAEKEIKLLLVNQEVKDLTINQLELAREKLQLESDNLRLEAKTRQDELVLLRKEGEIHEANIKNSELVAQRALQEQRLTKQQLAAERKDRKIYELQQREKLQELELARKQAEEKERQIEIDVLTQEKQILTQEQEINQLQLEKEQQLRSSFYRLIGFLSLILLLILAGLLFSRRTNRKLEQKNNLIEQQKIEIEKERNESERLLLNVLPEETANELKEKGGATPKNYDKVSVLFTDFSGFTRVAEKMAPQELIEELGVCFKKFDEISEKYNLEKIKTIGDGYMCAGGIPRPNDTNPSDAVAAGLEMKRFMDQRLREKQSAGIPYWNMRIGIHTGPIVAGVVGTKKFAYDIWGDTVNTASRMEGSSEDGKINISEHTYQYIKDDFKCTYRGEVEVKNKGKIQMFFVEDES